MPGVGEDGGRVGVSSQEYLEQFPQQLLPQQGDGRIDLQQPEDQDVWTVTAGEVEEFSDLNYVETYLLLDHKQPDQLTCRECPLSARYSRVSIRSKLLQVAISLFSISG